MKLIFDNEAYSYQLLRTIGQTCTGGADINECISTAYRIKEGDENSWFREWRATAERLERTGDDFNDTGLKRSASEAYARASNYYRTAEFFSHANPDDPVVLHVWKKSRELFIKASRHFDHLIWPVEIPYEDTKLPGYYCLSDASGEQRPCIIMMTGYDGTAEELYFQYAVHALNRGYNVLLFEGPGQGRVIREQKIPFRPDWEAVVTPVVEYTLAQPEVEPGKIALMGISMGGYLAPRACAFEYRINACIANGGIFDFHAAVTRDIPPELEAMVDDPAQSPAFDAAVREQMKTSPYIRWAINDGLWKFNVKTPGEWVKSTRAYTLQGVAEKIQCPTLVIDSSHETNFSGQAQKLYDAITSPKAFLRFTEQDSAEEHCQAGAGMISNEKILNWLDIIFEKAAVVKVPQKRVVI